MQSHAADLVLGLGRVEQALLRILARPTQRGVGSRGVQHAQDLRALGQHPLQRSQLQVEQAARRDVPGKGQLDRAADPVCSRAPHEGKAVLAACVSDTPTP